MREDRVDRALEEERGFGWLFFAGSMLGLAGIMRVMDAIWAFRYDGVVERLNGVLGSNLDNYGWAWLGVGIVLIISSFLLLVHSQFARGVGFVAATLGGLSAMTWMPYYPVWALTYVAIAVLVFYALVKYGGREPV
jgi:hypothetical protein